jgi:putative PIN family toxin of toxin-antitoxin system
MIKAVVDTNVFVSGLLSDTGASAKLILRWLKGQFDLVISQETLQEYEYVLSHIEGIDPEKAFLLLAEVGASAVVVTIPNQLKICKDPDDDKFLESAVVGNVDFLVTKNIKHFPFKSFQNIRIVTISKFLTELETQYPE